MNQKDIYTITNILLIAGIIVCCFAQIVPWGEINVSNDSTIVNVAQFYSWGTRTSFSIQDVKMMPNIEGSQFNFYFILTLSH